LKETWERKDGKLVSEELWKEITGINGIKERKKVSKNGHDKTVST
jgi:hypothetical protein